MKRYLAFILVIWLFGCKVDNKPELPNNYIPETPKLSSDVMTPEVLWSFGRIGEPSVSPDGKNVVYTVTYFNIKENKSYRDIYVVPSEGGKEKNITNSPGNEFNVCWRPDGKKIGYLLVQNGSTQMWEINPDGTGAMKVSEIEGGISGFRYSPKLNKVLYFQSVKIDQTVQDKYPDLPLADARLETDIMYRHWDTWRNGEYDHIFVADYSPEKGVLSAGKDIMPGERFDSPDRPFGGIEQVSWHPRGDLIAYTCKKKAGKEYALSTNTDIYLYDLNNGKTSNFTEGMMGYDKNPVFSPDGIYIAWESMERDGYESDKNRLFISNLEKVGKTNLTLKLDQNAGSLSWSLDSKTIFFISGNQGTEEIYRVNTQNGEILKVTGGIHDFIYAEPALGKLVALKQSMSQPSELYSIDISTGDEKQLSFVNKGILDQLTMGKVEKRWMKTTDNKEMLTWVVYPPHFDPSKKYPALLFNEGGPQNTVSQFWSYRWNFQMMAANGYIVIAPNRRGVPGFGHEWLEQISGDYGGQNIQDLLTATDEMAKEPYVDKNRMGAVGASYGGYSVNYLAGNHKGRFKAFISHDGIFNFDQMYVTTEEMWFPNWDYGGPFWDKNNKMAQKSRSFSPHNYIQNWDTPILIIHGGKDYRIPDTQGMAAFNAAVLKGVPAEFLYFPEENHWVLKPQNGILWQRVFFNWLDKWLK